MGFLEKFTRLFSNDKTIENKTSPVEIFETKDSIDYNIQKESFSLDDLVDPINHDDNVNVIGSDGDVEGRYVDDVVVKKEPDREEIEKEQFLWEQQRIVNELRNAHIPELAVCSICGERDFPLFIGQDGKYYCRNHILPENSGRTATGKPPLQGHGTISYHSDGTTEYRQ